MKTCFTCSQKYVDEYNFCLEDGTALVEDTVEEIREAPPPLACAPDDFEITLGGAPMSSPPQPRMAPPQSSGSLRSFGGLERLGPVGKLKRFFFGER